MKRGVFLTQDAEDFLPFGQIVEVELDHLEICKKYDEVKKCDQMHSSRTND